MRKSLLVCSFLQAIAAVAFGQMPPIGAIDFYGVRTVPIERLRAALAVNVGDALTGQVRTAVKQLETIPRVERTAVDAVCCEGGKSTLYIGIQETGTPPLEFRPAPTSQLELPPEVLVGFAEYETAFNQAVQAGDFAEDDSAGYSLMHFPAARAAQEAFVGLASRYNAELVSVLRESANDEHRAIAAQVLAYSSDKSATVEQLVFATRDPHPTVRNNAVRALALLAGFARRNPQSNLAVPAAPLVDLLNSLVWTDRNKASLALMQISENGDRALLSLLKERALASLVEMARWKAPGHAMAPLLILGRIGGMTDEATFHAFAQDKRDVIIQAATR
jgi:hypothetical protein